VVYHGDEWSRFTLQALADESRAEPDNNRGEYNYRAVIERAFLVTSRQSTPVLEPIDAALDDVAAGVDRLVEDQRAPRSSGPVRALVAPLGNRMLIRRLRSTRRQRGQL
jgi:hypothetical protein